MAHNTSTPLNICQVNAQSLEAHIADIDKILAAKNVHIMGISESWLKAGRGSRVIHIPHYTLVRRDRVGKGGGGVALYIHESLRFRVVGGHAQPDVYIYRPEFLFVDIFVGSINILCGIIYSPPKCGNWSDVEDALFHCSTEQNYTILLGDLNINWDLYTTPRRILSDSLFICNLKPLPFAPTFHRDNAHNKIDYICVSDIDKVTSIKQLPYPSISEHDVLFATLSYEIPNTQPATVTRRDFRSFDKARFIHDLEQIDWNHLVHLQHVDDKVDFFTTSIRQLYDTHAPLRTHTPKVRANPG